MESSGIIWMWHVFFQLLDLNIMDIGWFNSRNDDFAGPSR